MDRISFSAEAESQSLAAPTAVCLGARTQIQHLAVRPVFFPLQLMMVGWGKASERRAPHCRAGVDQVQMPRKRVPDREWSWALLWRRLLYLGREEGERPLNLHAAGAELFHREGLRLAWHCQMVPYPLKYEGQFSRNSFLEDRNLAWFLRSLRILIEAWLAKRDWGAVTRKWHVTSQQAEHGRPLISLKGKIP